MVELVELVSRTLDLTGFVKSKRWRIGGELVKFLENKKTEYSLNFKRVLKIYYIYGKRNLKVFFVFDNHVTFCNKFRCIINSQVRKTGMKGCDFFLDTYEIENYYRGSTSETRKTYAKTFIIHNNRQKHIVYDRKFISRREFQRNLRTARRYRCREIIQKAFMYDYESLSVRKIGFFLLKNSLAYEMRVLLARPQEENKQHKNKAKSRLFFRRLKL